MVRYHEGFDIVHFRWCAVTSCTIHEFIRGMCPSFGSLCVYACCTWAWFIFENGCMVCMQGSFNQGLLQSYHAQLHGDCGEEEV